MSFPMSVLSSKHCHAPLKFRCPVKKSDDIRPTNLQLAKLEAMVRCKEGRTKEREKKGEERAAKCNEYPRCVQSGHFMGKSETLLPSIHLILIHVTCKLVKIAHPSPHKLSISPPKTASIIHTPHEFPTLWGRKKIGKIYPSFRGYLLQALQHSSVAASQHQRKQALWPPTKRALTCSDTPSR